MLKACRICKSSKVTKLYPFNKKFSIYHCTNCDTDLLDRIPSQKEISAVDDKDYFAAYEEESIHKCKSADLEKIINSLPKTNIKSSLDAGCAKGHLVHFLLDAGIDAYGIDLFRKQTSEDKKIRQKRILSGDFTKYDYKRRFDLITMFDFIEHVPDPVATIKKAGKLLNRHGWLIIVTPDIGRLRRKVFRQHWTSYYLEHIHCFSKKSLAYLGKAGGLKLFRQTKFKKTVDLHYFLRKLQYKYDFLRPLLFLTRINVFNPVFSIDDDAQLALFRKL